MEQKNTKEKNIEHIIKENLELMESTEKDGMEYRICRESMGGNAGANKVCVEFYVNNDGKIESFENRRNKFGDLEYFSGAFIIYYNPDDLCRYAKERNNPNIPLRKKIENVVFYSHYNETVQEIIKKCIISYNSKHWPED